MRAERSFNLCRRNFTYEDYRENNENEGTENYNINRIKR